MQAMILEKMVSAILMLPFLQISAQIISLNPDMNPHLLQGKNFFLFFRETDRFFVKFHVKHFSGIQMEIIRSTK